MELRTEKRRGRPKIIDTEEDFDKNSKRETETDKQIFMKMREGRKKKNKKQRRDLLPLLP